MDKPLTLEHKATNHDTWKHIHRVQELILGMVKQLLDRAHEHDQSKLQHPEVEGFTEHTDGLAKTQYGSEEYEEMIKVNLKTALDHHYANNRHHPEHFKNGIEDMTLIDLLELIADWKAGSERQHGGNIRKSIEINADRFNISPQLRRILENTIEVLS